MRAASVFLLAVGSLVLGCGGDDGNEAATDEVVTIEDQLREFHNPETGVDLRNDCLDARVMFESLQGRPEAEVIAEFTGRVWRVLPTDLTEDVVADLDTRLPELIRACNVVTGT